jgi:hypothetical protein
LLGHEEEKLSTAPDVCLACEMWYEVQVFVQSRRTLRGIRGLKLKGRDRSCLEYQVYRQTNTVHTFPNERLTFLDVAGSSGASRRVRLDQQWTSEPSGL